jgi:SAM-dependent methyltransferase
MAGFSSEWLALREPADHAARSADLTRAVLDAMPREAPQRILDLAAGTGSNLRYLVDAGPDRLRAIGASSPNAETDWLLVDHDPALLAHVAKAPNIRTRCVDLSTLDDRGLFDGRTLVTASALLDLVSEKWLRALAVRCAQARAAVLFALTYDGGIVCAPPDPDDAEIVSLVNRHQHTDKGFGPALGPGAIDVAARCFEALAYRVQRARSDWMLTPESRELQRQVIDGWAEAATDIAPAREAVIDAWRDRRLAHVVAGRSEIAVGHEDLAGWAADLNRGAR